jgi:hypothetical protein
MLVSIETILNGTGLLLTRFFGLRSSVFHIQ